MNIPSKLTWIPSRDSSDCGPAALAIIARAYGLHVSIARIRALAGTDLQGTSLHSLKGAAEELGFTASAGKVKRDVFEQLPLPAIAHLNSDDEGHFVVVHKLTTQSVELVDPANGFVKMSANQFRNQWSEHVLLIRPSREFKSSPQRYSPSKSLLLVALSRPLAFITSGGLAFLIAVSALATSWLLQLTIDRISSGSFASSVSLFALAFAVVAVFKIGSTLCREIVLASTGRMIELDLGLRSLKKILSFPIKYFETRLPGDIITRLFDISNIRQAVVDTLMSLVFDLSLLFSIALALLFYRFSLALIALALLPLMAVSIGLMIGPILARHRDLRQSLTALINSVIETVANIRMVKAFTAESLLLEEISAIYRKSQNMLFKSNVLTSVMNALTALLANAVSITTIVVGAKLLIGGKLSLGQLMFFYSAVGIYLGSADRLAPSLSALQDALVGVEHIDEIDQESPETTAVTNRDSPPRLAGNVSFRRVSFEYRKGSPILEDITFDLRAGETVAIIGETGAGKSTLASLITGLIVPTRGCIKIDGRCLAQADKVALRSQLAVVFQDAGLLNTTIKRNICLGHPTATMQRIEQCARWAGIHEFIGKLPNGYDYKVGAQGSALSSGQRQRIAIARALLKDAPILVLDEATSSLDVETEDAVLDAVMSCNYNRTTIIITHRLRTTLRADRIGVLDGGKLVEMGNHSDLMRAKGRYCQMWKSADGLSSQSVAERTYRRP